MKLKRQGSELKLVIADRERSACPNRSLISNLARGFSWREELQAGVSGSLGAIATREKVSPSFVRRCCDLAFLPTELIDAIVEGRQPTEITSETFKQLYPLPIGWGDQKQLLSVSIP